MNPFAGNMRYERKFTAEDLTVAEAFALVRRHPAGFQEVYPPRFVNNIYLDTPGLHNYHDHVEGANQRSKTRLRWYGSPKESLEHCVLERKFKRGSVSGKIAHALPAISANGHALHPLLRSLFNGPALPELWQADLRHLTPSLFNRYQRHYFLSHDKRFRLTVDSDLRFGAAQTLSVAALARSMVAPALIFELKFTPENAGFASAITNALPFRMQRCSKYVIGIEALARQRC